MIKTKPNNKQYQLIYKYCILGYSKEDILDRLLFSQLADSNPILYEDVIEIINNFNSIIKYKLCKEFSIIESQDKNIALENLLDKHDIKKYNKIINYINVIRLEDATKICKKYKKNIEDIKW